MRRRFLLIALAVASALVPAGTRAEVVTTTAPAFVDSTGDPSTMIDDFTEHTYSVPAVPIGAFADCEVTRKFSQSIRSLRAFIVGGRADDIGYVGSTLVTSVVPSCSDVGTVTGVIEITDQIQIDGDTATFLLRAQENCCCFTGWGSETQSDRANARIHWMVELGGLEIRAALGSDPSAGETTAAKDNGTKTAHIPLGSPFSVQLIQRGSDGSATPVSATYELQSPAVQPAPTVRSIYPGFVAIAFDSGATTTKVLQAVHLGNVELRITPADTSLAPVTLPIAVERPSALGSTHNDVDDNVIDLAHNRGVPPQLVKGQMQHESNFVGTGSRYEPLSIDLDVMSVNGTNWRTMDPYASFRLRTSDGLAQGASLVAEDIDPRSRYSIVRNGTRRPIAPTDELVSAREIYDQNDATLRWTQFSSQSRLARIRRDPMLLDFTAQTPTATSYGMFQVLYTTAIATRWTGANGGQRNPHFLFDTVANVAAGGGSVQVAMIVLRDAFDRANRSASADPRYRSQSDLEDDFRRAFNIYNHGNPSNGTNDYGPGVISDSRSYAPRSSSTIFQ